MAYLDYLKSLLSWHYFVGAGETFQAAVIQPVDDLVAAAKSAVMQRFWRFCEDEALPYLLQNYNLDLVESFTPPQTRRQVADAWVTWEGDGQPGYDGHLQGGAGTEEGILNEVARLGYQAAMIPVWQYKQSTDGVTDTIQIQPTLKNDLNRLFWPVGKPPWSFSRDIATEGEFGEGWWVDLNFHGGSSFWIVVQDPPFAFRRWGDPGRWGTGYWDALVTGNRVDLQRLYTTVRKFTPAEWSCRGIVFAYSGRYLLSSALFQVLRAVAVRATFDVWAVGDTGFTSHWDGTKWTQVAAPVAADLYAVATRSEVLTYAVGDSGTILRWNGTAWAAEVSGVSQRLRGCCFAGSDTWAVGDGGTILRDTGTGWAISPSPVATDLHSIFSVGPSDIWTVGAAGVALHWDGATWSNVATGTGQALRGVWGGAADAVWAVGDGGTILRWDGATWAAETSPTTADLYAVAGRRHTKLVFGVPVEYWAVLAVGDAMVVLDISTWKLAPTDLLGNRGYGVAGTVADNFWIATNVGQMFNSTVEGNVFSGRPWNRFSWDDGTRYNLKYVIKYMQESWET